MKVFSDSNVNLNGIKTSLCQQLAYWHMQLHEQRTLHFQGQAKAELLRAAPMQVLLSGILQKD